MRIEKTQLYLITDDTRSAGRLVEAVVEAACRGGADMAQFRPWRATDEEFIARARALREITRRHGALLIVNDRLDVAIAAEADGVHLGAGDTPVADAKKALGPGRIVGYSAHAPDEAEAATDAGADFITYSPVFPTASSSRPRPPVGPEAVRDVSARVSIPVFALGGIHAGNIGELLRRGVRRVAVVSAVTEAPDPEAAARRLKAALSAPRD